MQREINNHLQNRGIGTKAQQALKLQHEQNKLARKTKSREPVSYTHLHFTIINITIVDSKSQVLGSDLWPAYLRQMQI